MCIHGQRDRITVEGLGFGGASDSPRILATGMFGNRNRFWLRTPGVEIANAASKLASVESVNASLALTTPIACTGSSISIRETLLFGPRERVFLDEDSLTLVALARATEANQDRLE